MRRGGALLTATLMISAWAMPDAQAATRRYTISSFDTIRLEAPVTVILTTGKGGSAAADGDGDSLERLRVELSGRSLSVTMPPQRLGEKGGGPVTLRLSTGELKRIVLTGGGSLSVDRMKGLKAEIILGGNGDVRVGSVALDRIDLSLAGGGRAELAGAVRVANINVTGPGMVAADALRARQATISNNGPGSVALSVYGPVRVAASGSGDVTITGAPACTADNRGTGRISCGVERR